MATNIILGGLLILAMGQAGGVSAQTATVARSEAEASPPRLSYSVVDWRGVWSSDGSFNIDPTTESGKPQPNAPLTPEARKTYEKDLAVLAAQAAPVVNENCLPEGPPRMMRGNYPREVVVTPAETWILNEFLGEIRRIYTDGRKAPQGDDLDPSYEGYSTGHWEGDTLVFDTVGLKAGSIDSGGLRHSDQLTLHERMRRIDHDTLEDQITMTDPKVFTRPWTVTRRYTLKTSWEIKEFVCAENDRNPVAGNGVAGFVHKGQ